MASDRVAPGTIVGANQASSHPSAADRVADIKSWVEERTNPEQKHDAVRFLAEFDLIATLLNAEILANIDGALIATPT